MYCRGAVLPRRHWGTRAGPLSYPGVRGGHMKILVLLFAAASGARLLTDVMKPILA